MGDVARNHQRGRDGPIGGDLGNGPRLEVAYPNRRLEIELHCDRLALGEYLVDGSLPQRHRLRGKPEFGYPPSVHLLG